MIDIGNSVSAWQNNAPPHNHTQSPQLNMPGNAQHDALAQYHGTPLVNQGAPMHQAGYIPPQGGAQPGTGYVAGGNVNITQVHSSGASAEHLEQIPTAPVPVGECARVGISLGFTKNLGDYQSFKATVSVELPCNVGQVDATLDQCHRVANDRLMKLWAGG